MMVERKWSHFRLQLGDILVLTSASFGKPAVVDTIAEGAICYTGIIRFRPKTSDITSGFLKSFLGSADFLQQAESLASGAVIRHFGPTHLKQMTIPVPPVSMQQTLVEELEAEQALVNANRELIIRFEQKIRATLARVWGEEPAKLHAMAEELGSLGPAVEHVHYQPGSTVPTALPSA